MFISLGSVALGEWDVGFCLFSIQFFAIASWFWDLKIVMRISLTNETSMNITQKLKLSTYWSYLFSMRWRPSARFPFSALTQNALRWQTAVNAADNQHRHLSNSSLHRCPSLHTRTHDSASQWSTDPLGSSRDNRVQFRDARKCWWYQTRWH